MKLQKSFLLALVVGVFTVYVDDTISGRVVINSVIHKSYSRGHER
jgi:hypothetical protein